MLHIVTGRSGSGKTTWVREKIKEKTKELAEEILKENNIRYKYVNNKLDIYIDYSGYCTEFIIYPEKRRYTVGLTTRSYITFEETKILNKIIELLK